MTYRGLMLCTTVIVLGSAMLASQAARQRRAERLRHGREQGRNGGGRDHLSMRSDARPDLDTSITSRSIPP